MAIDLSAVANLATVLQLPATLISIVGFMTALWSDKGRGFLTKNSWIPVLAILLIVGIAVVDIGARAGWFRDSGLTLNIRAYLPGSIPRNRRQGFS
jgi:hypothetical protein